MYVGRMPWEGICADAAVRAGIVRPEERMERWNIRNLRKLSRQQP